jgi:hypothetical protein
MGYESAGPTEYPVRYLKYVGFGAVTSTMPHLARFGQDGTLVFQFESCWFLEGCKSNGFGILRL